MRSRRSRRGGCFASAAATAILPFGFLALQNYARNRKKSGGSRRRQTRRRR